MLEAKTEFERLVTQYSTIWNKKGFLKLSNVSAESFTLTSLSYRPVRDKAAKTSKRTPELSSTGFQTTGVWFTGCSPVKNRRVRKHAIGPYDGEFDDVLLTREEFEIGGVAKFVVENVALQKEHHTSTDTIS